MKELKRLSKNEYVSELPTFINNLISEIESKFRNLDGVIDFGRGILRLENTSTAIMKKLQLNADVDDVLSIMDASGKQIGVINNLGSARFSKVTAGIGTTSVSDGESYIDRLFCDSFRTRSFSSSSFDVEQSFIKQYEVVNVAQNNGVDIHQKKSTILLNYNSMISSGEKRFLINPSTLKKGQTFTFHLYQCGENDICQIASSDPMRPIRQMNGKISDVVAIFKGHRTEEPQFLELTYVDEKSYQGLIVTNHSGVTFRSQS